MRSDTEAAWERRRLVVESTTGGTALKMEDIQQRFGASKNSIYNDLKFLRSLGFNVKTIKGVITTQDSNHAGLVREITFPPQYKEAGVAILSYFAKILEQKYPETDARVSIVQHGNTVRLHIESDKGQLETIERTLSDYGKVVTGQLLPSEFLSDPIAVTELRNRLEIAKLELRLKEQGFLTYQSQSERRVAELERHVTALMSLVGSQLTTVQNLSDALTGIANAERLSPAVAKALEVVTNLASAEYSKRSESELEKALETLRAEDLGIFKRLKSLASSIAHSIAANIATPWVVNVINAFPK